jgi:hypothetical protein
VCVRSNFKCGNVFVCAKKPTAKSKAPLEPTSNSEKGFFAPCLYFASGNTEWSVRFLLFVFCLRSAWSFAIFSACRFTSSGLHIPVLSYPCSQSTICTECFNWRRCCVDLAEVSFNPSANNFFPVRTREKSMAKELSVKCGGNVRGARHSTK